MTFALAAGRQRCPAGTRRASKRGETPIKCAGTQKTRKSPTKVTARKTSIVRNAKQRSTSPPRRPLRSCKYGRDKKTNKCYSKKRVTARKTSIVRNAKQRWSGTMVDEI